MVPVNCSSLMSCRICGPLNIPALIFSIESPGNVKTMYFKQSPSVDNAFTNYFMRPSFVCRGENIIFFLSKSGWCTILGSPGLRSGLGGQFLSTQCFSRALLSHIQRKQGYFVYPRCWPRRKDTILRSTQMIQLGLSYCSKSMTLFRSQYSSQRQTECPIGTAPNKLLLCRRTHLKLRFELSINIRHSFGL